MPQTPSERYQSRRRWRQMRESVEKELENHPKGLTYPYIIAFIARKYGYDPEAAQHTIAHLDLSHYPYFRGRWYTKEHLEQRGVKVDRRGAKDSVCVVVSLRGNKVFEAQGEDVLVYVWK